MGANPEPVETTVQALPLPDVYLYETDSGATHLVNGTDYARARHRDARARSLCGGVTIPVGPDDALPDGVRHYAETLTPETIIESPKGVMGLTQLDLCGRCRASYGDDGVPPSVNVVRFEMDGSGWSR